MDEYKIITRFIYKCLPLLRALLLFFWWPRRDRKMMSMSTGRGVRTLSEMYTESNFRAEK